MSKLNFLFLVLASAAFGSHESTLTDASHHLKKTKGVSSAKVAELRQVINAKDATPFQKYFAAHLISASETCTSKENQTICPEVETLFKNRIEVSKLLGKKAAFGAARVRGDFYFDKGKFDPAAESYEFLTWAPGGQHEYAILKLGWSYLNKKEAKKAFSLWSQDLKNTMKGGQPLSRNLVIGLGQSFSENLDRSKEDAATLNSMSFSADDREALIEGLLDGLYFLTTPALKGRWAEMVRPLKIYPELANHMLVHRVNTLLPNCDYLSLLNDKTIFPTLPPSKELRPVLAQCVTLYKKNKDKALLATLVSIYENSDLNNVDPFFAFNFYSDVAHNSVKACQLGVYWAFREANSQKVALKEIASECKASLGTENTLNQIIGQFETLVKSPGKKHLERADSSAITLLALLMDDPSFHSAVLASVKKDSVSHTTTVVPTLLAEELGRKKQWSAITDLKQTMKLSAQPTKKPTIWNASARALLVEKIQKKDFAQTLDLIQELNLYSNLDEANLAILLEWSRVFYNDRKADVSAMVTRLAYGLTQVKNVEQYQVLVELLLNLRQDKEVSLLVEKFGIPATFRMHPSFDAQLFDRVLENTVVINVAKVKSAQYKKLIFLAQSLAKSSKLSPADFDIKGSSPLHDEFALLKKVYAKSLAARKENLGSLDKISRWVDFLQTVSAVSKRKWISYHLLQQAIAQSKDTLDFVDVNLNKLAPNQDISAEEWNKIIATLHDKVTDAKELLNDLSAKAKQTAERQAP